MDFLRRHGFEEAFDKLAQDVETSGFEKNQHHLSKSALSDKYGAYVHQNYKHAREIRDANVPLE